jgi:hypothetical protein
MNALIPWLIFLVTFIATIVPAKMAFSQVEFIASNEVFGMGLDQLGAFVLAYFSSRYLRKIASYRLNRQSNQV